MRKLTTIFGIIFCVSVIFTSCNKDKKQNNDAQPKTEIEKDAATMADIICEMATTGVKMMSLGEDLEAMLEDEDVDWEDEKIQKKIQEMEDLEVKMGELEDDIESFGKKMEEKYEGKDDNIEKAKEFLAAYIKSAEKCKDDIESTMGWDDMIQSLKDEMLSGYDEDGEPIKDDVMDEDSLGEELSNIESDAMDMAECYCMMMELSSAMDGEYDEEIAMEYEAVAEYCEALSDELEPIYSGDQQFSELMAEFVQDCQ